MDGLISIKPQSWFRLETSPPRAPQPPFAPASLSPWSCFLRLWGPHVFPVLPVAWFHLWSRFHEQPLEERWDTYCKVNVGIGSSATENELFLQHEASYPMPWPTVIHHKRGTWVSFKGVLKIHIWMKFNNQGKWKKYFYRWGWLYI